MEKDSKFLLGFIGIFVLLLFVSCSEPLIQKQPKISNSGRAVSIAVNHSDDDKIIVASETGGLFRSHDKGQTWTHISGNTTFKYSDLLYLPSNNDIVIATAKDDSKTINGGGIWRSVNGGTSWTKITLTPPNNNCLNKMAAYCLDYQEGNDRIWAGTLCGLVYSDDEGESWQYLSTGPGYNNDKTYAVIATSTNDIKILTNSGVKVSVDGGLSWSVSNTGLPSNIYKNAHNEIAVSPFNSNHIFWAFNYRYWDNIEEKNKYRTRLYYSEDNGSTWDTLNSVNHINRPPFVRTALSNEAGKFDIYYGNGKKLRKRTATNGNTLSFTPEWILLEIAHPDPADIAFENDNKTPLLLASDGGLHMSNDNGVTWKVSCGNNEGYDALQITEVIGQLHEDGNSADLYFATQDNSIWASPDKGDNWPNNRCCEGFCLNIHRDYLPDEETRLTGVSCAGCGNFISGKVLSGHTGFPNAPNHNGDPKLLKPGYYVQNTKIPGLSGNVFNLSDDNGTSWAPKFGFNEGWKGTTHISGDPENPVVFTAIKVPGTTPDGQELLGIKKITGILDSENPIISDVTGFGSLGIFPTMFAWYKIFGVNPKNPNHIIVPDIIDSQVKVTYDGGITWHPDNVLTDLVTNNGEFKFKWNQFSQISSFGFDPDCARHIMVGTQQAGIFETFNKGTTWEKVENSDEIPYVSSFFFSGKNEVFISSYGRGLWKYKYECPEITPTPPDLIPPDLTLYLKEPVLILKEIIIPIVDIVDIRPIDPCPESIDTCPRCIIYVINKGEIFDYKIDKHSNEIKEVSISGGEIMGFTFEGNEVKPPFAINIANKKGDFDGDKEILNYLNGRVKVKGLLFVGKKFKGPIFAKEDIKKEQLPRRKKLPPQILVSVPLTGIGISEAGSIEVKGYGFDRRIPFEFKLNGETLKIDTLEVYKMVKFDEEDNFTFTLPPVFSIGGHTVYIEQKTKNGLIRDATSFHITVEDYFHEK